MKDKTCSNFVYVPMPAAVGPERAGSSEKVKDQQLTATGPDLEKDVTVVKSKIVVVGDCGCGKTSLIHRYVTGEYKEEYTPTGFDTFTSTYNVSSTYKIQLSIWDTSGDAGYDRVRPLSYTDADLIMVCFSVSDPESMDNVVSKWVPEVREHCPKQPIMLVGCKTDMRNEIKTVTRETDRIPLVSYDQGLKTAKHIGALVYSETTAKNTQKSVNDVMEVAALSSAGTKNSSESTGSPSSFHRHRSFIRRKRFSGINEAKLQLRTEAAKSCVIM